jgi:hypothetical protein
MLLTLFVIPVIYTTWRWQTEVKYGRALRPAEDIQTLAPRGTEGAG